MRRVLLTLAAAVLVITLPSTAAPVAGPVSIQLPSTAPPITYRLIHSIYPSHDLIVTSYTDADLGLDKTGRADSSILIQGALNAIGTAGGGTLFLGAGTYRLDNPLLLPSGVTLRGEIGPTSDRYRYRGTILAAYAERGEVDGKPQVMLNESSGIRDCIIWYPEQNPDQIVPYPPSVEHNNASSSVDNVVFVNAYQAYRSGYHMSGRAYVRNLRGTALAVGVEIDALADTGRVEDVDLSPEYWAHSGLPGAPTEEPTSTPSLKGRENETSFRQFMRSQGVGLVYRRIDWTNSADVSVDGYNKGVWVTYSLNSEDLKKHNLTATANGEGYDFKIRDCDYGVYLDSTANSGFMFTRFDIQASKCGFYLGPQCTQTATLLSDTIDCPAASLQDGGTGRVLMRDCDLKSGPVDLLYNPAPLAPLPSREREGGGVLTCVDTDFAASACHINAGPSLTGGVFVGDKFAKPLDVEGNRAAVQVSDQKVAPSPSLSEAVPIDFSAMHGPSKEALFVMTSSPFDAVGDNSTDCSKALHDALHVARLAGGGIVFFPPGVYRISGQFDIPPGVELRGAFGGPHDSIPAGSCLMIADASSDPNGPATFTMLDHSGLRDLNFHYLNEDMANIAPFPFLIRGHGSGITIQNIEAANVSHFIDLMTYRCDNAFVDHIEGQPIHAGLMLGGGSQGMCVSDCQFNPSNWTFANDFNAPKVEFASDPAKRKAVESAYLTAMQGYGEQYVLGDCVNLRFYRNFVFAGRYGLHCEAQNGVGPSGYCLGLGVDGSTTALRIDALGPDGFPFVDSQTVTTSDLKGLRHDVEIGQNLAGTAYVYGINTWSAKTDSSIQVLGGKLIVEGAHLRDPGDPALDIEGGSVDMSASCVRRQPTAIYTANAKVSVEGDILPNTSAAGVDGSGNLLVSGQ